MTRANRRKVMFSLFVIGIPVALSVALLTLIVDDSAMRVLIGAPLVAVAVTVAFFMLAYRRPRNNSDEARTGGHSG